MATITLTWDNTAVIGSVNSLNQTAYKRIKAVGGLFSSAGFTPGNPLLTSAVTTDADVIPNRIYEFKVENNCTAGGPTANSNGFKEQIVFECIAATLGKTSTTVTVSVNLTDIDFTKVKFTLRKQSDDSLVATATENKVANAASHTFTGLSGSTGYYVELEYLTDIEATEVISSDSDYLNDVCGGNVDGFKITTDPVIGMVRVTNTNFGSFIDDVTGITGFTFDTGDPVGAGDLQEAPHGNTSGNVTVTVSGSLLFNPGNVTIGVNGVPVDCETITGPGVYVLGPIVASSTDDISVAVNTSACPP